MSKLLCGVLSITVIFLYTVQLLHGTIREKPLGSEGNTETPIYLGATSQTA